MEEKLEELKGLVENVKDKYDDFVIGVLAFAENQDTVDEMINFIRNNPSALTSDVLEYIDSISEKQHIVIVDDDGTIYEQEEWKTIQREKDYQEFIESGVNDSKTILDNLKAEFSENPKALERIELNYEFFANETPFNTFIYAKSIKFLASEQML